MNPYKILVKFPSRGRPERLFRSMDSLMNNIQDTENYHISLTLDEDDGTMNNPEVIDRIGHFKNTSITWGRSLSKINAINRDLPEYGDIILVMSDDMWVTFFGFDTIIRQAFGANLDQLLHIPDNDAKDALATMYIAGRPFYNRFGYIYDPRFKSLWCDNAIMRVAQKLGCYLYVDCPGMIFHANPAYGHLQRDKLFDEQQLHWDEDEKLFHELEAKNFEL